MRVANELGKRGLVVSPAGVRCVWVRHDLQNTKQRLKALEAKVAQEALILTEAQVAALEKAKGDKEAHGEFERVPRVLQRPGHVLCGDAEGRRSRIYQQTFIHTYSKVGFAKPYDRKTPLTAADILYDPTIASRENLTPGGGLGRCPCGGYAETQSECSEHRSP